jgi:hypothetical protein
MCSSPWLTATDLPPRHPGARPDSGSRKAPGSGRWSVYPCLLWLGLSRPLVPSSAAIAGSRRPVLE